jgi:hypothetical protein
MPRRHSKEGRALPRRPRRKDRYGVEGPMQAGRGQALLGASGATLRNRKI